MKKGFNLLKQQIEPPTVWTKIYDWMVSTARLIVIVVQILVVIAFGIRIVVDIQSNNLTDEVEEAEGRIRALQNSETKFRKIQNKTNSINLSRTNAVVFSDVFNEVNSYIPADASEVNIQLDEDTITISGKASVLQIGFMESSFKNSSTFRNTELVQIDSKGSSSNEIGEFSLRTQIRDITYRELLTADGSQDS